MPVDDARHDVDPRTTEQAIRRRVSERAAEWFPTASTPSAVRLRTLSSRPRCVLYAVHVGDSAAPLVLAKVRRLPHAGHLDVQAATRPLLRPSTLPPEELAAQEFEGLRLITAAVGTSDPAFCAVRPLDHLRAESTLLMDYVSAPTLRSVLMAQNRLQPRAWAQRRTNVGGQPWPRVGAWLRRFHDSAAPAARPARQSTRQEVVEQFSAYDDFLSARLGPRALSHAPAAGAALARQVLPAQLPLAVGHGDFAPRNMFLDPQGRLIVFDPMPRWRVPRYEDLSRFFVGLRLLGLQVHTRGAAFSQRTLEEYENAILAGYYDGEEPPLAEIRCYQLLILLDKWSALVDTNGGRLRDRARRIPVELATGYLRGQAHRLLELAESAAG
jgi:hypothetical protein